MELFNKLKTNFQQSGQLLQKAVEEYVMFNLKEQQVMLSKKTVLLLCRQAELKVDKLISLKPSPEEGLIAVIKYNNIQIKSHFTSEKIILKNDYIEGQLKLLTSPEFETESLVYRSLLAAWKIFLGGQIPNQALPEGVRVEGNKVYYTLPRNQLQLLNAFFHNLQTDSCLITNINQGELTIKSSVALNSNHFKLQSLYKTINLKI